MTTKDDFMILAVKCAPEEGVLSTVCKARLKAVELYVSEEILSNISRIISLCKIFPLRYAVHAPNKSTCFGELAALVNGLGVETVVFHNNYWEDEWTVIVEWFKNSSARLCIENTYCGNEPIRFMRRYGLGSCLDLEHLQLECAGVYEEGFVSCMSEASHVHLSGYRHGSSLWHTHIHHSPKHNRYMLDLLKRANYSGFVVSEAKTSLQTYAEFKKLRQFYEDWEKRRT